MQRNAPSFERAAPSVYEHSAEIVTASLEELACKYDAFLLDAYGVFWGSNAVGVLPGAQHAMEYLVSKGKYVGILSNSTQLASKEKEKLSKHGLYEGVHYHFLLTSGEVAKELLTQGTLPFPTPRHTYWVFGSAHPRFDSHLRLFDGSKYRETPYLEDADFIVIAIPHIGGVDQMDPEVFREMVQAVFAPIPVLCVNPDRFGLEGFPPRPVVREGSIARMFSQQQMSVYFVGKPSKIIYAAALRRFPKNLSQESILMIGDTPETDIRGAHGIGLDAALITKTGVMADLIEREGMIPFTHQLVPSDRPEFFLDRLHLCE